MSYRGSRRKRRVVGGLSSLDVYLGERGKKIAEVPSGDFLGDLGGLRLVKIAVAVKGDLLFLRDPTSEERSERTGVAIGALKFRRPVVASGKTRVEGADGELGIGDRLQ